MTFLSAVPSQIIYLTSSHTIDCWSQALSLSGAGSSSSSGRRPAPLFDVAYNPEDIKARLSGVPVFAVINKREEFVLVAGAAVSVCTWLIATEHCCAVPSQHGVQATAVRIL